MSKIDTYRIAAEAYAEMSGKPFTFVEWLLEVTLNDKLNDSALLMLRILNKRAMDDVEAQIGSHGRPTFMKYGDMKLSLINTVWSMML